MIIPLQQGDNNVYVEYVTLALQRAGYGGDISSEYGENVVSRVISFQNDNGLSSDGIVGIKTWDALKPYITGYKRIVPKEGETLESIARDFGISVKQITDANPDISDNITESIITVPLPFDVVPDNVRYTSYLSSLLIDGLIARYPFIKSNSAGKSVMGNELDVMIIGNGPTEVFFNASHHANEWITTPVVFKFSEDYAKAYINSANIYDISATDLYSSKTLYLLPLVNPDGVDLVNGGISDTQYLDVTKTIADNYPEIPYPSGWKANILGTDLNLNYPAGWMNARDIKFGLGFTSPAPRDFVGFAPLSAPESRAVYDYTLDHNFALTLSYHTQGNIIYWKYLDYNPENALEIGRELERVSGYPLETTPETSGYAGYKDWFISYYNRPGYTIEIGLGENPLPISDFPTVYPPNKNLMATALNLAQLT